MRAETRPLPSLGMFALLLFRGLDTASAATPEAPLLGNPQAQLEQRVENLLQQLTLEEKVALCVGGGMMAFKDVPRLNLPNMVCTDGPRGTHTGTAFPVGVALGATWNPPLLEEASAVMGRECRAEGATMLLGSMLNIQRDPLGGRFFELYTEDPLLNGEIAVACVKGVQSQKVANCIKVMSCNNREENRNEYMSMVSRRALNEIYFPGFKAGVERGRAWAVMTSANGVNGEFASDSHFLLTETLKEGWGFDGMTLTDWLGTRSTEKAAFAGLDVSMPYSPHSLFGKPLLAAVQNGRVPEAVVDDKARRVLRTMGRVGLLEGVPPTQGGVRNTPEHYAVSRRVAEESLVLLKNERQTLPLDLAKTRRLLVVGPNANQRFCLIGLGGSSWQESAYEITPLQGVQNAVGTNAAVQFFSTDDLGGFEVLPAAVMREKSGKKGFLAKYYLAGGGAPAVERVVPEVNFLWEMKSPDMEKIPPEKFGAEFTGEILPPVSGTYTLRVTAGGGSAWVFVDAVGGAPLTVADTDKGIPTATATVQMESGKPFFLRVAYTKSAGDAACRLEWALPTDEQKMAAAYARLAEAAKAADAVLVFAGIDHSLDSEGRDRTDMHFPQAQETLINHLARANPRTIVTLINGSPLELGGWLDKVPAVLEAWYPGMEGGTAIANVLFGKVNPSGKLPFSWPKRLADSPSRAIGKQNFDRVDYLEDVFVGYRYFDTKNVEPQFPFGYGLSYTTFGYDDLAVKVDGDKVKVSFTVKNTGNVAGAEIAQIYVAPPAGKVARPAHELKGFKKVFLQPGEAQTVEVELDRDAFAYFDEAADNWVVPPGSYGIEAGGCSRNLSVKSAVVLQAGAPLTAAFPPRKHSQPMKAVEKPNLASGRLAKASSEIRNEQGFFPAQLAVDGKSDTRWSSDVLDDQWLAVDLGANTTVSGVELFWEIACAAEYVIEISADGEQWREVARNSNGQGGTESLRFEPVTTRWIRMRALKRATVYGVSLWEFRVTADTVAATPAQALEQVPRAARWVVWAERPARVWEDSFVTGNGRHGTMVEGRPGDERIICVHEELFFRLWDREKVAVADIAKLLPEVRRLTDAGQTGAAATLADSEARRQLTEMGAPQIWPLSPHPAFDLHITTGNATNSTDYRRQLNLETGEALTRWDGVEMRVFSSRTHNANVVQIRATKGQKLNVGIGLEETPGRRANVFRSVCADATPGWLTYHAEYAADRGGYEGLARVTTKGGQMETEGKRLHVRGAEEILVVVRITPVADETSYRQDALRKEIANWPVDYQALLAPHAREHGAMFRRVTLDLGCAAQWAETPTEKMLATAHEQGVTPLFLEQMHAMGRYLLISSCGRYPPPLQGIWGGSWEPAWCGGFVMDANLNLAISAASMGDLPECAESYFGYVERVLPGWRLNAKRYLGCRGFLIPHYSDPEKGYLNHFNLTCPWMYWPASGGWCILPFFEHAQLTGDRDFLKKRVLPLYREMADFYEDYLTLGADGRYHLSPGISPENVPTGTPTLLCRDATMDVAVARQVFDVLLQAGQQLKLDRVAIAKWQAYRDRLPAYRVNEDGALAEWVDPRYRDIYEHRHNSHLYPVFPGTELLQPDADPALLKAAQVALDKRFAHDTDSAFGLMQVALTAARLHDVDKVRTNLDRFSRRNYVFAGLATAHYPNFFVYNLDSVLSLPRLLMEMLVFSQPGRIELLPAWPKEFPDGSIKGIRVQNGHKLDLVWAKGKLVSATLHPVRDDTCQIRHGQITKSVTLKAGKPFQLTP